MGEERNKENPKGEVRSNVSADAQDATKKAADDCAQGERTDGQRPLPEMDFGTFILSLASSALMSMGLTPHSEGGAVSKDLSMAKQTIDILGMLQEKTKGNLTTEEDRLLTELLYDLRLKYVSICKSS